MSFLLFLVMFFLRTFIYGEILKYIYSLNILLKKINGTNFLILIRVPY